MGRVSGQTFAKLGIRTIRELRQLPVEILVDHFGQAGNQLWRLANGLDERTVVPDHEAKSISNETTFSNDVSDPKILRAWLLELTEQVAARLRRHKLTGRTVQLKIRVADFHTITRAQTLPEPTSTTHDIWEAARGILDTRLPAHHLPVRLLGVGVSGLDGSGQSQGLLFDHDEQQQHRQLDSVVDQIKERFGGAAVRRASGFDCGG